MKNSLKYIGLAIVLFIVGFLIRKHFYDISFSQLKTKDVQLVNRILDRGFNFKYLFQISIGTIPLLYLIVKKTTKINSIFQGIISCAIIILCGFILWQYRIFQLNNEFQTLSDFKLGNGIQTQMSTENLNFELYPFIGFLIGTALSILIFKIRNKKN